MLLRAGDTVCRLHCSVLHSSRGVVPGLSYKETRMFKIVGSVVVYGFALLGLAAYLDKAHGDGRLFADD